MLHGVGTACTATFVPQFLLLTNEAAKVDKVSRSTSGNRSSRCRVVNCVRAPTLARPCRHLSAGHGHYSVGINKPCLGDGGGGSTKRRTVPGGKVKRFFLGL